MEINLIVAVSKNGVIGNDNDLPWHLPKDMKYFKETTKNSIVIIGRKNWESIPEKYRPLKDRINIVLTKNKNYVAQGAIVVNSLNDALRYIRKKSIEKIFIIGGSEIYSLFFPYVDNLYITEINKDFEGDTTFPTWDSFKFEEVSRIKNEISEKNNFTYDFVVYKRKR